MDDLRDAEEDDNFLWGSATETDGKGPTVYVFSDNDVHIRNNGAPEITTRFRSSFDPEPQWLDDPAWYDDELTMCEVRVEDPHPEAGFQSVPGTNADKLTDDTRNTGTPELATYFRSDFDTEPHSLDGPTWDDNDGRWVMSEVQDGLCLDSIQK